LHPSSQFQQYNKTQIIKKLVLEKSDFFENPEEYEDDDTYDDELEMEVKMQNIFLHIFIVLENAYYLSILFYVYNLLKHAFHLL
jgi:hypothetical protein